jgi:hypothetical protein
MKVSAKPEFAVNMLFSQANYWSCLHSLCSFFVIIDPCAASAQFNNSSTRRTRPLFITVNDNYWRILQQFPRRNGGLRISFVAIQQGIPYEPKISSNNESSVTMISSSNSGFHLEGLKPQMNVQTREPGADLVHAGSRCVFQSNGGLDEAPWSWKVFFS